MTSSSPQPPSLDGIFSTEADSSSSRLGLPLLRLLAHGEPVAPEHLAAVTGRPVEQVRTALAGRPDIEYDQHGHIVGCGITLRPTPYRLIINGTHLYTWCALDTLVFPAMLGQPATVESTCHATGTPIRIAVEPDRITAVQPATTVVSLVTPADRAAIRTSFCNQVHFFASAHDAAPWLSQHPGASVLPAAQARQMIEVAGGKAQGLQTWLV